MPGTQITNTLHEMRSLLGRMTDNLNSLTIQMGNVDFVNQVGGEQFTTLDCIGGILARRMPNLKSNLYTVLEVIANVGAECYDYRVPQQVTSTVMRGIIRFRIEDGDWVDHDSVKNNTICIPAGMRRSYQVVEDALLISIFTPPLL